MSCVTIEAALAAENARQFRLQVHGGTDIFPRCHSTAISLLACIERQESARMKRPPPSSTFQTAVEIALILILVAVIFLIALVALGPSLEEFIRPFIDRLQPA